ncbi:hypothetical protein SHIRM173S_03796 [Streptomyces hirsutus]
MLEKDLSLVVRHHTLRGHAIPLSSGDRTMTDLEPARNRPEIAPAAPARSPPVDGRRAWRCPVVLAPGPWRGDRGGR